MGMETLRAKAKRELNEWWASLTPAQRLAHAMPGTVVELGRVAPGTEVTPAMVEMMVDDLVAGRPPGFWVDGQTVVHDVTDESAVSFTGSLA